MMLTGKDMTVVEHETPPMWDEINAAFKVAGERVIFAWENLIYNPIGFEVSRELRAHEAVHGNRQIATEGGVRAWWSCYIYEPSFRLQEEIPAHRAEYQAYCKRHHAPGDRHRMLLAIADRLSSSLYGGLIKRPDAVTLILARE